MKFEINRTKIKGGCQSGRKVVTHNFKSDLPLDKKKLRSFKMLFEIAFLHNKLSFIKSKLKWKILAGRKIVIEVIFYYPRSSVSDGVRVLRVHWTTR